MNGKRKTISGDKEKARHCTDSSKKREVSQEKNCSPGERKIKFDGDSIIDNQNVLIKDIRSTG